MTLSWRRVGSSSALALTLVVGLPALVQAQLFPNLYTHRQRAECANEPPFYGHVRRDFYGYYPTCWRKFPEGWGCPCPNPELPNLAAELVRQPRDPKDKLPDLRSDPDGLGTQPDPFATDPGAGAAPDRRPLADPTMPALPRSNGAPFSLDPRPPAVPGGPGGGVDAPLRRPTLPDSSTPAAPGAGRPTNPAPPPSSPFDTPGPTAPRASAGARSVDTLPSLEAPKGDRPGGSVSRRPAPAADDEPSDPVLALPAMSFPADSIPAGLPVAATPMPPSLPTTGSFVEPTSPPIVDPATQPAATQAPRRTSLIGGLFSGQGLFRRR